MRAGVCVICTWKWGKEFESEASMRKLWILFALVLCSVLVLGTASYRSAAIKNALPANAQTFQLVGQTDGQTSETNLPDEAKAETKSFAIARYRLDASQSRFMVRAFA